MLWWTFTDPSARTILVDWETEAAALLARFRAAAHLYGAAFLELTSRLLAASPEVREWWPRHEIAPLDRRTKRLRHAVLGELALRPLVLRVADDPAQGLVTFDPGDDEARIAEILDGSA
jgi:MmyB-like transcription regulator ligand binding domain